MFRLAPSPVQHLARLSTASSDLWVKRDDLNEPEYGGNKLRKLPHLFAEAERAGAKRLLLVAPAGSHQVLATAIFARKLGLPVAAVMVPQPRTDHAAQVLRASIGLGVEVHPARGAGALLALWRLRRRSDFLIPIGGSSAASLAGHIAAAGELAEEVLDKRIPTPDVLVVALASAGTAVGLAAGLAARKLSTRVLGVCSSNGGAVAGALALVQLARLARIAPALVASAARRLRWTADYLGNGYSTATPESARALELGRGQGLTLDPAYTAKAFAAALDLVGRGGARNVIFWQTLSSAPLEPLLRGAPAEAALPRAILDLLLPEVPCASS